jgi:hypothetical protein
MERRKALDLALRTFSHDDPILHDHEMSLGADKVLCLKLGYVVVTTPSLSDEITMICQCLLKIYQCSPDNRKRSFRSIGATELLPLLIQVWMTCIAPEEEQHEKKNEKETILIATTQVLRIFAKTDSAKSILIRQNHGVWLERALQAVLEYVNNETTSNALAVSELLGLVKDLTFRSQHSDKDVLLRLKGGILQKLLNSCCTSDLDVNSKIAEWFTAVIWNLVLDKACCYQLLRDEGQKYHTLIKGLLKMFNGEESSKQLSSVSKSKRNAVSALGNILSDPANQTLLFSSENPKDPLAIVSTLIGLVENDSDSVVRRRAMRTLRCLANSSEKQVKVCFDNGETVSFLVDTISRNVSVDDENDRDMQIQACHTVSLLLDSFEHGDWPCLETAILQRIETTIDPKLITAMCRCLVECVKKSPWKRGPACFSGIFWNRLENAVSISVEPHEPVSMLFLELVKLEQQSGTPTSSERPSALTSPAIVNAMATLLSHPRTEQKQSRDNAIDVVLLLLNNENNKRPLAENEGLLSALVNICLMNPGPRKDMAKKAILELVPAL